MRSHKVIVLSVFALLAAVSGITGCGSSSGAANANNANIQAQVVDVTTVPAASKSIPTYFEATGTLASDISTDVAPAVGGKIVSVNFDVGSYVEKGSVLVRLDDRDARIRLEQAEAQLGQQQKAVNQAIAGLRQAQARLGLNDGETLDIETTSQVRSFKANFELAEKEYQRARKLFASGDISRSALDQRLANRDSLGGQLDEARSNAYVALKSITLAETQVASAKSGVTTAQTQVEQARKSLADTTIYAPISGYVSERIADPGEFISPNTPNAKVATIVRTSTLRMRIDVPEASIGKVSVGQGISLQTSAYPDRSFAGTVVRMLPALNASARTLTVEAEVSNGEGLLKPGQFATVRITQSKPESAVMIPASAVKTEGDINKVFVVKDGAARERIVQLGLLENGLIQVKTGVAEGDLIAASNINSLFDGVLVRQTN
jgi:RND family efflux transporter MFP subunit